jgi:hypothetical protein
MSVVELLIVEELAKAPSIKEQPAESKWIVGVDFCPSWMARNQYGKIVELAVPLAVNGRFLLPFSGFGGLALGGCLLESRMALQSCSV